MSLASRCHLLRSRLRVARLRRTGLQIAPPGYLGPGVQARLGWRDGRAGTIALGPDFRCEEGVIFDAFGGSIAVGQNVFFGPYSIVYGHGGVVIGDHCLIAMHCRILSSNHSVPAFDVPIRSQPDVLRPTRLGRDVWLGAGVTVLGGVTIGDGCIVGAGSVVTKDLPPGAIAFGNPCAVRKFRPASP